MENIGVGGIAKNSQNLPNFRFLFFSLCFYLWVLVPFILASQGLEQDVGRRNDTDRRELGM